MISILTKTIDLFKANKQLPKYFIYAVNIYLVAIYVSIALLISILAAKSHDALWYAGIIPVYLVFVSAVIALSVVMLSLRKGSYKSWYLAQYNIQFLVFQAALASKFDIRLRNMFLYSPLALLPILHIILYLKAVRSAFHIYRFRAVLVASICIVILSSFLLADRSESIAVTNGTVEYINFRGHTATLKMESGWKRINQGLQILFIPTISNQNTASECISIGYSKRKVDDGLQSLYRSLTRGSGIYLQNYMYDKYSEHSISGVDSISFESRYTNQGVRIRMKTYMIPYRDICYILSYSAPDEKFESGLSMANNILSSFGISN